MADPANRPRRSPGSATPPARTPRTIPRPPALGRRRTTPQPRPTPAPTPDAAADPAELLLAIFHRLEPCPGGERPIWGWGVWPRGEIAARSRALVETERVSAACLSLIDPGVLRRPGFAVAIDQARARHNGRLRGLDADSRALYLVATQSMLNALQGEVRLCLAANPGSALAQALDSTPRWKGGERAEVSPHEMFDEIICHLLRAGLSATSPDLDRCRLPGAPRSVIV